MVPSTQEMLRKTGERRCYDGPGHLPPTPAPVPSRVRQRLSSPMMPPPSVSLLLLNPDIHPFRFIEPGIQFLPCNPYLPLHPHPPGFQRPMPWPSRDPPKRPAPLACRDSSRQAPA